ncbi:Fructosamine kinase-domain-containing protein [Colletotrichum lupini]|nr:Fructosamine kinase-domain-containing protein [Colletotrichum lupini]
MVAHELTPTFESDDPSHENFRLIEGGFPLFNAVVEALPAGTTVLRATDYGDHCSWFRIGRIETRDQDNEEVHFFTKYGTGDLGKNLLGSEYQSQCNLYSLIPDHVPKPISCGSLGISGSNEGCFLLTQFIQFDNRDLPDPDSTGALIAKLHSASKGASKNYGTAGRNFDGMLCYLEGWEKHWHILFAKILFQVYHYNVLANGLWEDLDTAIVKVIHHVIPKLLSSLRDGNQGIEPTFIHGDLWNGNFGTADDTGKLYVFDSSGYYAHHEMEFAYWRTEHHRMHQQDYCGAYFKHFPPSDPAAEFEDRMLLYTLKPLLLYSSMNPGHITRQR